MIIKQYFGDTPPWQSYVALNNDQLNRILAYSLLTQIGASTSVASAKALSTFMQGWTPDNQLDALAYYSANGQGLGTQATTVNATVGAAWGGANGIVDSDAVKNLLLYAWLVRQGMSITSTSLPSSTTTQT